MTIEIVIEILKYLGVSSAAVAILFFFTKKYFTKFIENNFDKRLETHKNDLALITENARFDYQRKIQDFNLYTIKKHEKYVELHKLIMEAHSWVSNLYGLRSKLTYEEHNEGDFIILMKKENFPQGKIDEVMTMWKMSGKANAIKVLDKYLRLIEFQKAEAAVYKARNHHFLSQLYLSDEVEKMSLEFLNKLHSVFIDYEMIYDMQGISSFGDISKISDSAEKIKKEVDSILDNITKQMQSELSIGYYKQKAT